MAMSHFCFSSSHPFQQSYIVNFFTTFFQLICVDLTAWISSCKCAFALACRPNFFIFHVSTLSPSKLVSSAHFHWFCKVGIWLVICIHKYMWTSIEKTLWMNVNKYIHEWETQCSLCNPFQIIQINDRNYYQIKFPC